jgi:hypothetical protein
MLGLYLECQNVLDSPSRALEGALPALELSAVAVQPVRFRRMLGAEKTVSKRVRNRRSVGRKE